MKHYGNMTIGMTVDKSEAKNSSEQIYLAPTPYLQTSQTPLAQTTRHWGLKLFKPKPHKPRRRTAIRRIFSKCIGFK